ncbi:chemotaxis protein CheA [Desulfoferrobacter suflitae]|uniref:chemotaxis protein CheA n=1 Tax=Desulfoferrobacter suflitae TaxID=2865782 RepID=UPI0021645D21|nr:chemotaxis protein CheA [Desulfoferrobacter suflitae]MCK8602402.1 chemotaxis protein CheA [Desulfoferrobacter suflitae]
MQQLLNKLANSVIGGPDDLAGIGEILNLLDLLEAKDPSFAGNGAHLEALRKMFNHIILDESQDRQSDWLAIQRKVAELCDNGRDQSAAAGQPFETVCEPADPGFADAGEGPTGHGATEIFDPELVRDFLEEARDHLSSIEMNLLALETDPENLEAISAIFRPFHSIKGVSGFLNLPDIHNLTHHVENLLDEARAGKLKVTEQVIDLVLEAVDILKMLLDQVKIALQDSHPVQACWAEVEAFCKRLECLQDTHGAAAEAATGGGSGEAVEPAAPHGFPAAVDTAGEPAAAARGEMRTTATPSPSNPSKDPTLPSRTKERAASVRIDTWKLDNLVDMVGELVIAQSMVLQNPDLQGIKNQKLQKDSIQLRRITNEMQRIAMSMRMVPIKNTFQKMTRLVRDLSRKSGKEVALAMHGEETEIDRNMVEEIYDPLVHMIRNSIDHGIETPEERTAAGKNRQGTILIAAEQKGGNIVIDIRDDGRGLDTEKIRDTAVRRGVISGDEQLDEKSIYELIFHPGFSTKDEITEVSGRGVGMDVVKKCIEHLRGKMEIFSIPGQGTQFQFKLPLTMAIIDGMIIRIGDQRYVVPTISLQESLRPLEDAYVTVQGKGELIKVRKNLMPLIRLHRIFEVEPRCHDPWEGLLLVVNEDGRPYCLLADEIVGRQEVVIKSLGGSLGHIQGVSGGAILGDGRVTLIIDVKGIVKRYKEIHNDISDAA